MVEMTCQIPVYRNELSSEIVSYKKHIVIGRDLYEAYDKAIEAGHDPNKTVRWRVYGD